MFLSNQPLPHFMNVAREGQLTNHLWISQAGKTIFLADTLSIPTAIAISELPLFTPQNAVKNTFLVKTFHNT